MADLPTLDPATPRAPATQTGGVNCDHDTLQFFYSRMDELTETITQLKIDLKTERARANYLDEQNAQLSSRVKDLLQYKARAEKIAKDVDRLTATLDRHERAQQRSSKSDTHPCSNFLSCGNYISRGRAICYECNGE